MLAIAAVTLSTMHQSSLGSLYLLMPNMLAPQWWSPVMPVSFFLSSVVAGTALVILIDMWIAKGWRRPLEMDAAGLGGADHVLVARSSTSGSGSGTWPSETSSPAPSPGRMGLAFAAEIVLGGFVPLVLLAPVAPAATRRALLGARSWRFWESSTTA